MISERLCFLPCLTMPYLHFPLSHPRPSDHHSDWSAEDSSSPTVGSCSPKTGSLLRVRCGCPLSSHVHLRPHRSLAGLHLVQRHKLTIHIRFKLCVSAESIQQRYFSPPIDDPDAKFMQNLKERRAVSMELVFYD